MGQIGLEERPHNFVSANCEESQWNILQIVIGDDPPPDAGDQFGVIVHQFLIVTGMAFLEKKQSALSEKVGSADLRQRCLRSEKTPR